MKDFSFHKDEVIQQDGNSVIVLSPEGGSFRSVAFCENTFITAQIVAALKLWQAEHNKALSN